MWAPCNRGQQLWVDAGSQHWCGRAGKDRGRAGNTAGSVTLEGPVNQHTNLKDWSRDWKRERCKRQVGGLVSVHHFSHGPQVLTTAWL